MLRMNERSEPQRQNAYADMMISLDRLHFGNFHEVLTSGSSDSMHSEYELLKFGHRQPCWGHSEIGAKVLLWSTEYNIPNDALRSGPQKSYWRVNVSVTEWCDWSWFGAWSLEGREIVSFIQPRHAFAL